MSAASPSFQFQSGNIRRSVWLNSGDATQFLGHIAGPQIPTSKAEGIRLLRGTSVVELSYVEKPISGWGRLSRPLSPHVETTTIIEPARLHH